MKLNESEQRELLYESTEISEESNYSGRWTEHLTTIVQTDDGKFYRINWERGLTEMQEDVFEDGEVEEVFAVERLNVQHSTIYLSEKEREETKPTLVQKMVSEAPSFAIATGESIRTPITERMYELAGELREEISALQDLDLAAGSGAFREATKQYLETITELWERKDL